jgi:hypothetical protein
VRQNLFQPRPNYAVSYSRMREVLRSLLSDVGEAPHLYGLHSLRSGGTTDAANAGLSERLIQKHGRWQQRDTMRSYVHESVNERLSGGKEMFSMLVPTNQ